MLLEPFYGDFWDNKYLHAYLYSYLLVQLTWNGIQN